MSKLSVRVAHGFFHQTAGSSVRPPSNEYTKPTPDGTKINFDNISMRSAILKGKTYNGF